MLLCIFCCWFLDNYFFFQQKILFASLVVCVLYEYVLNDIPIELILIGTGGEDNHHLLLENRNFSRAKYSIDLRPFSILEIFHVEKKRGILYIPVEFNGQTKFESTFFIWQKRDFCRSFMIFGKISIFKKNSQRTILKAKSLSSWILAIFWTFIVHYQYVKCIWKSDDNS